MPRFQTDATCSLPSALQIVTLPCQDIETIIMSYPWTSHVLAFSLVLAGFLAAINIKTRIKYTVLSSSRERVKTPPTVPYTIPFIGNAVSFGLDPARFFMKLK